MDYNRLTKFTAKDTHTVIDPVKGAIASEKTKKHIDLTNFMVRKGCSIKEIAQTLGISQRTVWRRYYGYMDMHYMTRKEDVLENGEYTGPKTVVKNYMGDVELLCYPTGYVRMHIGAHCSIM